VPNSNFLLTYNPDKNLLYTTLHNHCNKIKGRNNYLPLHFSQTKLEMCAKITLSALWLLRTTNIHVFYTSACYQSHGVAAAVSNDRINQPVNVTWQDLTHEQLKITLHIHSACNAATELQWTKHKIMYNPSTSTQDCPITLLKSMVLVSESMFLFLLCHW